MQGGRRGRRRDVEHAPQISEQFLVRRKTSPGNDERDGRPATKLQLQVIHLKEAPGPF
jgi:hypothetical protein